MSAAEDVLYAAWSESYTGYRNPPDREHRFHPTRRWRFDFAWPAEKLAVEIEGRGRHQTFVGFAKDTEKYNTALLLGWRVLRYPAAFVKPGKTRKLWPNGAADMVEEIKRALSRS